MPLESVVPPVTAVYVAAKMTTDNAQCAEERLRKALATHEATTREYLGDILTVYLRALRMLQPAPSSSLVMPSTTVGTPVPPIDYLHNLPDGPLSDHQASMCLASIRAEHLRTIAQWVPSTDPPPSLEKDTRDRFGTVLAKYAADCHFKATGDAYVHACVKLILPGWMSAKLTKATTPFPVAAETLGEHANDTVRPIIDIKPSMVAQEKDVNLTDAQQYAVLVCLAAELLNTPTIAVGDAIATQYTPDGPPVPFACGDFPQPSPDTFGVLHQGTIYTAVGPPLDTLYHYLMLSGTTEALQLIALAHEGTSVAAAAGNPLAKYLQKA